VIPISESVRLRRTPWITGTLVALCVLVFLYELLLPSRALDLFIQRWGANPRLILLALAGDPRVPRAELLTLFTSQFLHGGWVHLLGNMIFLWVFGRAVEDRVGHLPYLALYLLGGAAAGLFQSWMSGPGPTLALIGASGAIATILGAYLVMFPTAWVTVLMPIFFFFWAFDVPAVLMLAFWFFGQFFTGIAFITQAAAPGNVAVWAHVSGFVLGAAAGILLPKSRVYVPRTGLEMRRAGGPGPAGLVSSVANLITLLLGARIVFHLLEIRPGFGLLGDVAGLVYSITNPFVRPFEEFVPWLLIMRMPLDLPALVLLLLVYLVAGALVQATHNAPSRRSRW